MGILQSPFHGQKHIWDQVPYGQMKRTGACQLQYVSDRSHKPRLAVVWVTPTPRAVAETGHHQQCNNLKAFSVGNTFDPRADGWHTKDQKHWEHTFKFEVELGDLFETLLHQ